MFARDITEASDKAAYLTNLRMMGVRLGQRDTSELVRGRNSPERRANRRRYRRRIQAEQRATS